MKLLNFSGTAIVFYLLLCFSSRVSASEPEHFCYFITQSNKVLDLSSLCPRQKNKLRLSSQRSNVKLRTNKSKMQPPKISHYPPPKFHLDKLKQE